MRHMRALIAMYIAPVLVALNLPAHSRFDELIDGARMAYQADKVGAFDSWKSIEPAVLLQLILPPVRQAYDFIHFELTALHPGNASNTPEVTMQGFMLILLSPQNLDILSVDDPNDKVLKQKQDDIVKKMKEIVSGILRENEENEEKRKGCLKILSTFWPAESHGKKEFLAPVTKVLDKVYELANNLAADAQPKLASELQTQNSTQKPASIPNVAVKAVQLWQILSVTQLSLPRLPCLLDPSKCPLRMSQETILEELSRMMDPLCNRRRRLQGGGAFNGCAISTKKQHYHWPNLLIMALAVVGGIAAVVFIGIRYSTRRRELQNESTKVQEDLEQPEGDASDDKKGDEENSAPDYVR